MPCARRQAGSATEDAERWSTGRLGRIGDAVEPGLMLGLRLGGNGARHGKTVAAALV
jgi:hypothetical protein